MLFRYNNKVYVRPFANRIVEVVVKKNGDVFDVQPTSNKIEVTSEVSNELYSISLEESYKLQNKSVNKEKSTKILK